MKSSSALWIFVAAVMAFASPSFAEVLGDTQSDGLGTGKIQFEVDPSADSEYVAQQLTDNVRVTENGEITAIRVENGIATIEFAKSTPSTLVEAVIDDELAALLKGAGAAGAAGGAGGPPAAALIAGGAAVAGGVGYGIYTAVDSDDDDDDQQTGTPAQ